MERPGERQMAHLSRGFGIGLTVFVLLTNTGSRGSDIHDCAGVKLTCGSWAAKDKNTCRTCQQAQCRTENGKDVLAGNKTQTQCYEGHGAPPPDKKQ
jgi:hypothetical protein